MERAEGKKVETQTKDGKYFHLERLSMVISEHYLQPILKTYGNKSLCVIIQVFFPALSVPHSWHNETGLST